MKKIFLILSIVSSVVCIAQNKSVVIMNATIHIGNDSVIQNGIVGIKNGKIVEVIDASKYKVELGNYDEKIDATGKHVYPGLIAPNSTLGLTEIESVRATNDFREVSATLPNVRSVIAYNTDSKIIPTVRTNGVLLAQITPRGGLVSGTSSVLMLDGWNWEDAAYKIDDGIHVNWPRMQTRNWNDNESTFGASEKNKEYEKQVNELKKLFSEAKAYNELETKEEKNIRFESMADLFNGKQNLYIHANNVKEIVEAVNFSKSYDIKHLVIVGGQDSWMVTDLLKENKVSVIVNRVHDLPGKPEDDVDLPFKLPYLLHKAGVLFCLNNEGDMEAMGTRNLPFMAGTAAAYGLTKEQALAAVTLNTAKILGVDKTTGSIEAGKDANLFISSGDALDMRSNNVTHAFVKGKQIDLNNEQKELYEKYKNKYGIK
ncbi:MAG: amidohydrolase family protein [Bacteroidia bacterium]|nr:amidohydrolase family protein [Bacteroidia bacterium]